MFKKTYNLNTEYTIKIIKSLGTNVHQILIVLYVFNV